MYTWDKIITNKLIDKTNDFLRNMTYPKIVIISTKGYKLLQTRYVILNIQIYKTKQANSTLKQKRLY